jgi:hypothetical protein
MTSSTADTKRSTLPPSSYMGATTLTTGCSEASAATVRITIAQPSHSHRTAIAQLLRGLADALCYPPC